VLLSTEVFTLATSDDRMEYFNVWIGSVYYQIANIN